MVSPTYPKQSNIVLRAIVVTHYSSIMNGRSKLEIDGETHNQISVLLKISNGMWATIQNCSFVNY